MITQGETGQTPINLINTIVLDLPKKCELAFKKKKVLSVEKSISTELIIALTN